jgi:hypothetical protein
VKTEEFFEKLCYGVKNSLPLDKLGKGFSTPTGEYRDSMDYDDPYYLTTFHTLSQIYTKSNLLEFNPEFGIESCLCQPIRAHLIYFRSHPSYYILSTNLKRRVVNCNFIEVDREPIDALRMISNFSIAIIGKIEKKDFLPVVQNIWESLNVGGCIVFRYAFELEKEILNWGTEKNGRSIPTSSGIMIFYKEY